MKLRQVDVLVRQGQSRVDTIRHVNIVEQIYYRCAWNTVAWERITSRRTSAFARGYRQVDIVGDCQSPEGQRS